MHRTKREVVELANVGYLWEVVELVTGCHLWISDEPTDILHHLVIHFLWGHEAWRSFGFFAWSDWQSCWGTESLTFLLVEEWQRQIDYIYLSNPFHTFFWNVSSNISLNILILTYLIRICWFHISLLPSEWAVLVQFWLDLAVKLRSSLSITTPSQFPTEIDASELQVSQVPLCSDLSSDQTSRTSSHASLEAFIVVQSDFIRLSMGALEPQTTGWHSL